MAQYYAGSEICIAATASPHARHGVLRPRIIGRTSARLAGEAEGLSVRSFAEDVISLIINIMGLRARRPPISCQPLNARAWGLQERLFAKRIVHYTEQQMIWQCQTCLVGEDGQVGEDLDGTSNSREVAFDLTLGAPLREITAANENEHNREPGLTLTAPVKGHTGVKYSLDEALNDTGWYELLEAYTKRSLTYRSDLLPALSALASEVQKSTRATYLAGLWAIDGQIPFRSLLWFSVEKNACANNGSPSWAWSSVLGPVSHPSMELIRFDHPGSRIEWVPPTGQTRTRQIRYDHTDSQMEILSFTTNLATSNIFGQVRDAELRITGLVHDYTGAEGYDFAAEGRAEHEKFALTEFLDTEETKVGWKMEKHVLLCVAEFRDNAWGQGRPEMPASDQIQFIILRHLSGEGPQCFMRIGTAKLVSKDQRGLARTHSAYTKDNGWTRETLVLV